MGLIELTLADRQGELDDYIEAQVPGPVRLHGHTEELVLDPGYRGTPVQAMDAVRPGCLPARVVRVEAPSLSAAI